MIIVSGLPRSGTSLMMSILRDMGIPILGEKYIHVNEKVEDELRKERIEYLNPEGFYEVRGVVGRGLLKNPKEYSGKAIKIVIPGILRVKKEDIEKIILCIRNPIEILTSQKKLVSNTVVYDDGKEKYANELTRLDFNQYITRMMALIHNTDEDFWNKTLVVDYHDVLYDTENQLKRISDFLKVDISNIHVNIKKDLHREKLSFELNDPLALTIFKATKNKDFSDELKSDLQEYIRTKSLENVKWLDDTEFKTWTVHGYDLHKSLITNNNNVLDKLLETVTKRTLPTECKYYFLSEEEYTIKRPHGLKDLTRKKILCKSCNEEGDFDREVSREFCFECHQRYLINQGNKKHK